MVPMDGTPRSASVVPLAIQLARGFGCNVMLLKVVDTRNVDTGSIIPKRAVGELAEVEVQQADDYLRKIAPQFEDEGISTAIEVRVGDPVKELLNAAEGFGCDVITMATRARRNLGRLAFGSVADSVVRESSVPVLLYRVAA